MYFQNFDRGTYDYNINGETKSITVVDITKNVRVFKEILSNITLYDDYDIQDGETPEIIAEKIYGNAQYHWVIMILNERLDGILDFPQPDWVVQQLVEDKYGPPLYDDVNNGTNPAWEEHHHYVKQINGVTYEVSEDEPGAEAVSNREYEFSLNESKRRIKLISPLLLEQFLNEFDSL